MFRPKMMIFDCDGVISDTANLHFESWREMMKLFEVDLKEDYIDIFRGVQRKECLEILKNDFSRIDFTKYDDKFLLEFKNNIYNKKIASGKAIIYEKTIEIIEKARKEGIKIGLASVSCNSKKILKEAKIINLFDFVIDPISIINSKPDPEIFIKVSKMAGIKNTRECIGFEDALVGVQSIINAKMFCVGIGDYKKLSSANIIFNSTSELSYSKIMKGYDKFFK